jgi:hypothetical protein
LFFWYFIFVLNRLAYQFYPHQTWENSNLVVVVVVAAVLVSLALDVDRERSVVAGASPVVVDAVAVVDMESLVRRPPKKLLDHGRRRNAFGSDSLQRRY